MIKDIKILSPGIILRKNNMIYINQITGEESKRLDLVNYLNKIGISEEDYYNLIMNGDINFRPKCKICKSVLKFHGLSKGYYGDFCPKCKNKSIRLGLIISMDTSSLIKSRTNISDKLTEIKYTIINNGEITKINKSLILGQLSGNVVKGPLLDYQNTCYLIIIYQLKIIII